MMISQTKTKPVDFIPPSDNELFIDRPKEDVAKYLACRLCAYVNLTGFRDINYKIRQ